MTNTLEELTELIIEWGAKKGIYDNSSYEYQLNKTLEEVTELHKAILDNDVDQIKDAIGDIYVTLVMASQFNKGIKDALKYKIDTKLTYKSKKTAVMLVLYNLFEMLHYNTTNTLNTHNIIETIAFIGRDLHIEFTDCVEHAYNIISKRTGKMTNGQFIKDE